MKRKKLWLYGLLALTLSACGEYFLDPEDVPDEYQPDSHPRFTAFNSGNVYSVLNVRGQSWINMGYFTISNGLSFANQTSDDKRYLLSTLLCQAEHGDSLLKVRIADAVDITHSVTLTGVADGEEWISFVNADGDYLGRFHVYVQDPYGASKSITFDRNAILLMAGDYWDPGMNIEPSYCVNREVIWTSSNEDAVGVNTYTNTIYARNPGTSIVTATSTSDSRVSASVVVTVIPNWYNIRIGSWRYETVVYASIIVDGFSIGASDVGNSRYRFGAKIGDEYRGAGRTLDGRRGQYDFSNIYTAFRVGSNEPEGETIEFVGYNVELHRLIEFSETLPFDAAVHGSLSGLIQLNGHYVEE